MKVLLVDAQPDVQKKWVAPLRKKGWGVVLARSAEDAYRMMLLHGEGVEAFIVHESFVSFAEAQDKPFVVLTERWKDRDIIAHQNSKKSAVGYLPRSGPAEHVQSFLTGARKQARPDASFQAAGPQEDTNSRTRIRLRDASRILSSPSIQRPGTLSVSLNAPKVQLRTRTRNPPDPSVAPALKLVPRTPAPPPPSSEGSEVSLVLDTSPPQLEPEREAAPFSDETGSLDSPLSDLPDSDAEPKTLHTIEGADPLGALSLDPDSPPMEEMEFSDPMPSEPRIAPAFPGVEMTPDLEAMRAYLTMREQDVAVLTGQVRSSKERIAQLETQVKVEKARNAEIQQMLSKAEQKIKNYDLEKRVEMEVLQNQVDDVNLQLKDKTEKARVIETRLRLMSDEVNQMKERVRLDIRRIRVREKELESQLEILKKDSGALLQARDEKILELKRRNDLLEFNMELVQEQYEKERRQGEELKGKLKEAAQAMKQANGFLEH